MKKKLIIILLYCCSINLIAKKNRKNKPLSYNQNKILSNSPRLEMRYAGVFTTK